MTAPPAPGELAEALGRGELGTRSRVQQCAGSIMDKKAQGSGSGKVLGIGERLASACSANAPLERSHRYNHIGRRKARGAVTYRL